MPGQATHSKDAQRKPKKRGRGRQKRDERKRLTRRLRDAIAERPLELPEMIGVLGDAEDEVLAALRVLGKKSRGRLRSGVLDGRNCWWWVPPAEAPPAEAPPAEAPPAEAAAAGAGDLR